MLQPTRVYFPILLEFTTMSACNNNIKYCNPSFGVKTTEGSKAAVSPEYKLRSIMEPQNPKITGGKPMKMHGI